jgi:hypothetical protein
MEEAYLVKLPEGFYLKWDDDCQTAYDEIDYFKTDDKSESGVVALCCELLMNGQVDSGGEYRDQYYYILHKIFEIKGFIDDTVDVMEFGTFIKLL